jgi:hypothetical protein
MSEKQTKRLRRMAKLFYASQPPHQEKKSVDAIYKSLKTIHQHGLRVPSHKSGQK